MFGDAGFGSSININSYNGSTYITNQAGTANYAQGNNIKFANSASGYVAGATSGLGLRYIPNDQSSLRISVVSDSAIQVQNAKLYGCWNADKTLPPSGVTMKAAEIIHPSPSQTIQGSGDSTWTTLLGTGAYLDLVNSPNAGGQLAGGTNGSTNPATQHDWYIAYSLSPSAAGSQLNSLVLEFDYI
jgi:hypothetical protein